MGKLMLGVNDLLSNAPDLAEQWHSVKNGELSPDMISVFSAKKVWWLGPCGHEWEAVVASRTRQGSGCPFCSGNRVLPGFNDIATTDPLLIQEWDYEKNEKLPSEITRGSTYLAWWLCPKGHSYSSRVGERASHKRGCPYCANHAVLKGFNDLEFLYPQLASEWHPVKNGELKPSDIMPTSVKKVWWLGPCGHEWQAFPANRIRNKGGCPVCLHRTIVAGINDMATTDPEMAQEWHPTRNKNITPRDVSSGSNKKIWWLCSEGHEWYTSPNARKPTKERKRCGCPICANRGEHITYQNSLAVINPELAKEWHPTKNNGLKPEDCTPGSNQKVWWLGPCGHEWEAGIYSRCQGRSCPYCSGNKVLKGFNDLESRYPAISKEWDCFKNNKKPSEVTTGTHARYWWTCEQGHSYKASVNSRTRKNSGCPICTAKNTSYPEQYLYWGMKQLFCDTRNREVIDGYEYDIWIPSKNVWIEYSGAYWHMGKEERSAQKERLARARGGLFFEIIDDHQCKEKYGDVFWVEDNTIVLDSASELDKLLNRVLQIIICDYMGATIESLDFESIRKKAIEYSKGKIEYERSLECTHPRISTEWDYDKNPGIRPVDVTYGSKRNIWWICPAGHSYQAMPNSRTSLNRGCPICANRGEHITYQNSLAVINPELAKEWHPTKNNGLKPEDCTPGSNQKVWWLGPCGHEWEAGINERFRGSGCPICGHRKLLAGYNDLQTINPTLSKEWHPTKNGELTPSGVMPNSKKKVWWLGSCGHEWQALVSQRNIGTGCPYCHSKKVLAGFNDLQSRHPDIAKKWDLEKNNKLKPCDVMGGSGRVVWWKCDCCGFEWEKQIRAMVKFKKCPNCNQ